MKKIIISFLSFAFIITIITPHTSYAICDEAKKMMQTGDLDMTNPDTLRRFKCLPPASSASDTKAKNKLVKSIVFTKDISAADKALVRTLFTNNTMPNIKGVVVYSVDNESAVGPDKATFNHVRTRYTFNGVETEKEVLYHFKNGVLDSVTGDATFPKSFAKAKITKAKALNIAQKQFNMVAPVATSKILYSVAGSGDKVPMVMGWYVHPKGEEYPYVTINALNGAVISSDDGIRY